MRRRLSELYPTNKTADVASALGVSVSAVYNQANANGLKKDPGYLSEHVYTIDEKVGRQHRFKKGAAPWNKGKHHSPPGSEKGQFKKGRKPQTWVTVGTERLNKDGILERKVADTGHKKTDWVKVHVQLWEEHNGLVPSGHMVVFKDGDQSNIVIDNLECITRADNMRRNSYHRYPEPIPQLIQLRGVLTRQINARARNEKQNA